MAFQPIFAKILVDPALAGELREDPERFADRFGLDPAQVTHLAQAVGGLAAAVSVTRFKRAEQVRNIFPGTFTLVHTMGEREPLLRCALAHERLSGPESARAIGHRLSELAATFAETEKVLLLREMIRFETLWYDIRKPRPEQDQPSAFPMLPPTVVVVTFLYPIAELQRRVLSGGQIDDPLHEEITHYVLEPKAGLRTRVRRISEGIRDLLSACDGDTSPGQIAVRLGVPPESVERALGELEARGLIRVPTVASGPRHFGARRG